MGEIELKQQMALGQSLSQQMQHSLALLQAPVLELRSLIQQELESNPLLEESPSTHSEDEGRSTLDNEDHEPTSREEGRAEWHDFFAQQRTNWTVSRSRDDEEKRQFFFDSQTKPVTLTEHLYEQLRFTSEEADVIRAGVEIIGNLDERGYLTTPIEEIARELNLPPELVGRALSVVQALDPAGVGARDLQECLLLQLQRMERGDSIEAMIVRHALDELGRKRYADIAKKLNTTQARVIEAAKTIATLQPRVASSFGVVGREDIVVPEAAIMRHGDSFVIVMNEDALPHLRISDTYKDLLSHAANDSEMRGYVREKLRSGKFLIKCLELRQQTLHDITAEILQRQEEFFEKGPLYLRPLTMAQVADAVGVHETTVSRATAGKFLQTPHGLFEYKYFFTSGYHTTTGDILSNTTVKSAVQEIIGKEDPKHPVSDQAIVEILAERGIPVARRTVAKYRTELNILPTHLRKMR